MTGRWNGIHARLTGGQIEYWRERLAVAEELMETLQTGQSADPLPLVREVLLLLAEDPKWEVRKVIANGLNLVVDEVFDEIAARLLNDPNGFVKRSAEQSFRLRRRDLRQTQRRDAGNKQLAGRIQKARQTHGDRAADEVVAISELRFNQLAGSIAHDLRSILTHLQPAARGLRTSLDGEANVSTLKRKATRVVDGLAIMDRCVTDMERYTQPLPVERQPEDLTEVLRAACEMAAKNIEELGYDSHMVVLRLEVPDGLRLRLARHLAILAMSNLVKNAYESFMERNRHLRRGEILIEVMADEENVEITIRDDGMGMASEDLGELASGIPRRRNKAKRKSTGFGVPIARRYIKAHGGTLGYESTEDVGTTVRITLPRTEPDCSEGVA